MYNSTLSLTSALDGGGWLVPPPGHLTPGKWTRYALYRRLGGPQGRSGRVRKMSPPPGFDPRTVQLVASRYTDYVIPAHWKTSGRSVETLKHSNALRRKGTHKDRVSCFHDSHRNFAFLSHFVTFTLTRRQRMTMTRASGIGQAAKMWRLLK
jgi:hypothetical protein